MVRGGPEPRGLVRRGPRRESQTASVRGQDPPWQGAGSGWGWAPAAVPAESLVPAGGRGGRASCGCGHKRPRRRWLRQRESSPTAPHGGRSGRVSPGSKPRVVGPGRPGSVSPWPPRLWEAPRPSAPGPSSVCRASSPASLCLSCGHSRSVVPPPPSPRSAFEDPWVAISAHQGSRRKASSRGPHLNHGRRVPAP